MPKILIDTFLDPLIYPLTLTGIISLQIEDDRSPSLLEGRLHLAFGRGAPREIESLQAP